MYIAKFLLCGVLFVWYDGLCKARPYVRGRGDEPKERARDTIVQAKAW
jgi:hypothetical protein